MMSQEKNSMYYLSILRGLDDEKILRLTASPTFVHFQSFHYAQTCIATNANFTKGSHHVGNKTTSWPFQHPLLRLCRVFYQQIIR